MLSERCKTLREAAGLTQIQLAKKAKVSQQLIGKIEADKVRESRKLPQIARALNMTVEQFLGTTKYAATTKAATIGGVREKILTHGFLITPQAARVAADWDKLDPAGQAEFEEKLAMRVAKQIRKSRPKGAGTKDESDG